MTSREEVLILHEQFDAVLVGAIYGIYAEVTGEEVAIEISIASCGHHLVAFDELDVGLHDRLLALPIVDRDTEGILTFIGQFY